MSWFGDLRYGLRSLRKNPGFTLAAVGTVALGIGSNTAIFSTINAVLLRPLPYANPDRLVVLWEKRAQEGTRTNAISPADYLDWRASNHSFEALDAEDQDAINLTGDGKPERLTATIVTSGFAKTYAIQPALGRLFNGADESGDGRIAVLSHSLWTTRFGADPNILDKWIRLDDKPYRVVGVLPPGFRFFFGRPTGVLLPLVMTPEERNDRGGHRFLVIGRLRPGVDLTQARADMDTLSHQIERAHPMENTGHSANLLLLNDQLTLRVRPVLMILMGCVGLVLLIACANVANLLFARANYRQREMMIRQALGASTMRLARIVFSESLLLSLCGAALGLLLARLSLMFVPLIPESLGGSLIPGLDHVVIDSRVLMFSLVSASLSALIFGCAPMLRLSQVRLASGLRTGTERRTRRVSNILVVTEVAMASMLLIGATLLISSFGRLLQVDPGFQSTRRLSLHLSLPEARYNSPGRQLAFYSDLLRRAGSLPSVNAAAITTLVPGNTWGPRWGLVIEGRPKPRTLEEWPKASWRIVSDTYLSTMGIPVERGRGFTPSDTPDSEKVVLLSQATVAKYWGSRDPIGTRIGLAQDPTLRLTWRTVIGITGNVKYLGRERDPEPEFYLPLAQISVPGLDFALIVRSRMDAALLANPVQRTIAAIDPNLPISDVKTIDALLDEAAAPQRFNAVLMGVFSALAGLLAFGGLYSTLLYLVSQRTHEMGVRLALGARPSNLIGLLLWEGGALALCGIFIGMAGAAVLSGSLRAFLFGISPLDPAAYAVVGLGMLLAALLASLLPAWRASRVDPVVALRSE